VLFIGDKGMLIADYSKHKLLPETKFKGFTPPKPFIPDSPGQHQQWINAILNGTTHGQPLLPCTRPCSTIGNHLGNVAYRAGKKLLWDAQKLQASSTPRKPVCFGARTPPSRMEPGLTNAAHHFTKPS